MSVFCECWVLSGRCLCFGLITRQEESYRFDVSDCDLETSTMRRSRPTGDRRAIKNPRLSSDVPSEIILSEKKIVLCFRQFCLFIFLILSVLLIHCVAVSHHNALRSLPSCWKQCDSLHIVAPMKLAYFRNSIKLVNFSQTHPLFLISVL